MTPSIQSETTIITILILELDLLWNLLIYIKLNSR